MVSYRKVNLYDDYAELQCIWENSKMGLAPPMESLPNDGVVSEIDGEIVGCLFIYFTSNSYNALLGYPLLDKEVKENRNEIVEEMLNIAESICKYYGFRFINTWSPLNHVQDRLVNRGYQKGDEGVTHLIKII